MDSDTSGMQSEAFVNPLHSFFTFFGINPDVERLSVIIRKLAHFAEYFTLCLTATLFITSFGNKKLYPLSPTYCLVIAICDEFVMQMSASGRAPMWIDVIVDLIGALTAYLLFTLWAKKEKQK